MFKTKRKLKAYKKLVEDIETIINSSGEYATRHQQIRDMLYTFRLCEILDKEVKVDINLYEGKI